MVILSARIEESPAERPGFFKIEIAIGIMNLRRILCGTAFLFILNSCTQAISNEVRDQVDPAATFKAVFHDPDSFKGKTVLWGGRIIQIRNTKDTTWIELLQQPLARNDRPVQGSASEGRFLIRHEGFLDPAVYGRGRELTLVGEVRGRETRRAMGRAATERQPSTRSPFRCAGSRAARFASSSRCSSVVAPLQEPW